MQPHTAKILSQQSLYDLPDKFRAWPSIACTAAGDLLVVFSGDRKHYVDPYGKTLLISSSDQGQAVEEEKVVGQNAAGPED